MKYINFKDTRVTFCKFIHTNLFSWSQTSAFFLFILFDIEWVAFKINSAIEISYVLIWPKCYDKTVAFNNYLFLKKYKEMNNSKGKRTSNDWISTEECNHHYLRVE